MAEGKTFKIEIAKPAKDRYQNSILQYLYKHFSFDRAIEIDENILNSAKTLSKNPYRGRREKYLESAKKEFRFILHKETKYFEIKIIYYVDELRNTVNITDFFPTKMSPQKISRNK